MIPKEKIKEFVKKHFTNPPYIKDYLFVTDLKSSIFVTLLVSMLEIWMIISSFRFRHLGFSESYFYSHLIAYIIFLVSALAYFIYSTLYLKQKTFNKTLGYFFKIYFTLISIAFAFYICYYSGDRTGQVFIFITITTFILCTLNWHPIIELLISAFCFAGFFIILNKQASITYSMRVNGFTAWIFLVGAGINLYYQRILQAQKSDNIETISFKLQEKNRYDELTQLYNMYQFRHAASEVLKDKYTNVSELRFVFINIENFKNYNEKYGFYKGNDFLINVSKILKHTFTDSLLARFSDDHFAILTKNENLTEKLYSVNNKLKDLEENLELSIKAGIFSPKNKKIDPNLACDYARYACSSINKKFGVNIVEYSDSMEQDFKKKQYIINNLETAIKNGYIKAYYQPVVLAENSLLCGAEALARWDDPQVGFLSPADFIPILEEYNLISKLDLCIMNNVCQDLLQAKKDNLPLIPISINFSRLDFQQLEFVYQLEACIKNYNLPKQAIHIEITESALSDSDDKLKSSLEELRSKGYSLWLDDFGSGYSSLNVLKDYNFNTMKIDMKFLSEFSENIKSKPILTSIIELAKKLDMTTLTEGVETIEAKDFLKSIGCDRLQGYYFGKPMPKEKFANLISDGTYKVI